MQKRIAVVLVAVLAACGGEDKSSGPARPSGSLASTGASAVVPSDSISFETTGSCTTGISFGYAALEVAAADVSGLCSMVQASQDKANMKGIAIAVLRFDLTGAAPSPIGAGVYAIAATPPSNQTRFDVANVVVTQNDATCNGTGVEASSGNVWIDSVTSSEITGAVDVTLTDGTRVVGTFQAPRCTVPGALTDVCSTTSSTSTSTCVP